MVSHIRVGKTNAAILAGEDNLSVWTDEELMRGQRRDRNGGWSGRPPKVVPRSVHDELVRRKMSKAHDLLRDNVVAATEVLVDLATDPGVDGAVRLKAATTILDRVLGKAPDHVTFTVEPPWAVALRHAIVATPPLPPGSVVEATAVGTD